MVIYILTDANWLYPTGQAKAGRLLALNGIKTTLKFNQSINQFIVYYSFEQMHTFELIKYRAYMVSDKV